MNNQNEIETIWAFAKSLEGKVVSMENAVENMRFITGSKELANTHEWLYHCTTAFALKSIIENRELWLSNLTIVNDKEEEKKIDVPDYKNKFYIGCFTYDSNISEDHWDEYGSESDGILIGMKKEWFIRKAIFMCEGNLKCTESRMVIKDNYDEALMLKIEEQQRGRWSNPFYIESFGFYQVIYGELVKNIRNVGFIDIDGIKVQGSIYTSAVAGIIKPKHGVSERSKKERDWTKEKEVRLKVGIRQMELFDNGYEIHDEMIVKKYPPKIAVPISDDAFSVLKIGFSPKFKGKDTYIKELKRLLPKSEIEIL